MLKYRIISFVLLLGILALLVGCDRMWPGRVLFFVLALPATVLVLLETAAMLGRIGVRTLPSAAAVAGGIGVCAAFAGDLVRECGCAGAVEAAAVGNWLLWPGVLLAGWWLVLTARNRENLLPPLLTTAGMTALVLAFVLPLIHIYFYGIWWLLYFLLTTKAGDTGGYIVGKLTSMRKGGNHKVAPSISPGKSYEGVVGGLVLSVAVSCLFWRFGNLDLSPVAAVALGVLLYAGGFAGDLTESALKRACGVKDSGGIVPGMGGVFDVVDSFVYNAPMFMLICPYL